MQPTNTNSVLLSVDNDCVIFDAWGLAGDWEKLLNERGLKLCAIYSTHGHADHISAAPELSLTFNIPWYLNHADLPLIKWGNDLLEIFEMPKIESDYKKPLDLVGGMHKILSLPVQIIDLPGHSLGGVGFYFKPQKLLIVGDTLFANSVGRTDLPGSSWDALKNSISKIYNMNLSDDTVVVPGHEEITTIGKLKNKNSYFKV